MGFWIFMLIMDLLLPFTMIGFGRYFMKKAPKEINSVFGYRTSMSMKNKDTWKFAHKYCGKVWYVCGIIMLPITVIFMLLVIGKNESCLLNLFNLNQQHHRSTHFITHSRHTHHICRRHCFLNSLNLKTTFYKWIQYLR